VRWRRLGAVLLAALLVPPALAAASVTQPRVQARAWAVEDARSGEMLASHAAAQRLPIASTTKLMTAYVALQELPLERTVRAAPYHATYGESLMGLRGGQRVSVRDLLYGLILRSGNDAAYDLALAAAGSEARFVRQMNLRAAALGLADTHYANPIGLDERGNYSSARDLLALTRRLLEIPAFAKIADSRSVLLRSVRPPRRIATINELLRMAPWATGVKTGHTFGARYVLVGAGRRGGVDLVSVAIGAPSDEARYRDNLELLEYGFDQYDPRVPIRAGQDMAGPSIRYTGGELPLLAARTLAVGLRRGQRLRLAVHAPGDVGGPVRKGAVLGHATVFVDGRFAGSVPLRASRFLPEAGIFDRLRSFVATNSIPFAVLIFAILIGAALLYRRRGAV
jgi:serine-type D-Ala-D-Ala carboxypeptidase (penicillin-binding protein 5/6)